MPEIPQNKSPCTGLAMEILRRPSGHHRPSTFVFIRREAGSEAFRARASLAEPDGKVFFLQHGRHAMVKFPVMSFDMPSLVGVVHITNSATSPSAARAIR